MLELNKIYFQDCLEGMKLIDDKSIDMILCDLPFGTTYQKWDEIIDFTKLWGEYRRVSKENAAIVLFASQPFTTLLNNSALDIYKYEWIWDYENPTNFPNANKQPLKQHGNISIFYKNQCVYNPQKTHGKQNHKQGKSKINYSETRLIKDRAEDDLSGQKFPKSILYYPKHSSQCKLHPNQKPLALCEYLIKTYSNEGHLVLDNCMGSGTTALACKNLNRNFIGFESDKKYYKIACQRID